ncbi:beta-hexosaminidase subunit beta-like isoform X1 [Amphiura filiformis]|uniref:beta-hexosaminidase subunit beta-like isoform X1 n=1 Tax=Amphiura filiformis TaxID=82378 RepID=UPI003B21ABA8
MMICLRVLGSFILLSIAGIPFACEGNLQGDVGENVEWPAVTVPTEGSPWPLPQNMQTGTDVFALSDMTFRFSYAGATSCNILDQAFLRYFDIIFYGHPLRKAEGKPQYGAHMKPSKLGANLLPGLTVAETDCSEMYPSLQSNENYTLTVSSDMASLKAASIWGVLKGLETFSQLVYESDMGGLIVNSTTITDFPRFAHRGFLIDTSRHFVHVKYIFQMIDALAYNRMNVLHWHIVDYQSFPYESKTFPFMSQEGAFSPMHVYTQLDIAAVIAYARDRGVRVMPEFDTPGHAASWASIKDFLTPCYSGGKPDGTTGPVNPIVNATYDFLGKFFGEIHDVFPDNYVHVGGDEVSFKCWQSNPDITEFMKQMGFGTDYAKLEQYYMQKLLALLDSLKVQSIVWQEVVDNGVQVSDTTVVQVWLDKWQDEFAKATKAGHRVLLSTPWYLNRVGNPYSKPWHADYKVNPRHFNGTAEQKKLVMGGEACMWGEYVDGTNIIQRTWPRASTIAERLWSASTVTDVNAAAPRLAEQRCRMVRRGLQASPVTGPGFCKFEYDL